MNGPANQKSTSTEQNLTLTNTSPTKSGFEFKGWCTKSTSDETCTGTTYQPGQSYPLSSSSNTVTLYAMWYHVPTNLGNLGNMQSFTCSKISYVEDYGTVTDTRDNNTYKVAKLKDGKCWMIDNLKLGSTLGSSGTMTLASNTSDVTSSFTLKMTPEKYKCSTSSDSVRYNCDAAYVDSTYGGYYTWHTATAGTGTYEMDSRGTNATSSICAKGWRLPTGCNSSDAHPENGEFYALAEAYGGYSGAYWGFLTQPVPNFSLLGFIVNNGEGIRGGTKGDRAYYWSSTYYSNSNACMLYFAAGSTLADDSRGTKNYGYSVRCVARQ